MPGRTWLSWVVAALVATSVITLGPSGTGLGQVSGEPLPADDVSVPCVTG